MVAASTVRALVRRAEAASLAVTLDDGRPYAALVLIAVDQPGAPLLFISDLAEHTKALRRDPQGALLIDGTTPATTAASARLTGSRATLTGTFAPVDDPLAKARFLRRQPEADRYRDFADFHLWRMTIDRAHLVAGFGKIAWIDGADCLIPAVPALIEAEAGFIDHMNADHGAALRDYAVGLDAQGDGPWTMIGIDPQGIDLLGPDGRTRIAFPTALNEAAEVRPTLVTLANDARERLTATSDNNSLLS